MSPAKRALPWNAPAPPWPVPAGPPIIWPRCAPKFTANHNRALSDESWCASDVTFHRAFVDAAGNPVMSYQLAGAVEAMQPLMNMITFTARSREKIIDLHAQIADAVETAVT
jgi:DNA-binding FadR family transcriptional regulator